MLNIYEAIRTEITDGKLECDELVFCDYKCLEPNVKIPVWSQQHHFIHVISGQKSWTSRQQEYLAPKGTTLFIEKGAKLAKQFFDEEMCMLMFFYTDSFIKEIIDELPAELRPSKQEIEVDTVIELSSSKVLLAYFDSVIPFFMQHPPPPKAMLRLKFKELLMHVFTDPQYRDLAIQLCSLCSTGKASIKRIMEENYMFDLKIEDYARLAGRSLSGFKREFQDLFEESPGKWIIDRRLRLAKELLADPSKQVNQVAWDSGFENASHFTRAFKQNFGSTPSEYRTFAAETTN